MRPRADNLILNKAAERHNAQLETVKTISKILLCLRHQLTQSALSSNDTVIKRRESFSCGLADESQFNQHWLFQYFLNLLYAYL